MMCDGCEESFSFVLLFSSVGLGANSRPSLARRQEVRVEAPHSMQRQSRLSGRPTGALCIYILPYGMSPLPDTMQNEEYMTMVVFGLGINIRDSELLFDDVRTLLIEMAFFELGSYKFNDNLRMKQTSQPNHKALLSVPRAQNQ